MIGARRLTLSPQLVLRMMAAGQRWPPATMGRDWLGDLMLNCRLRARRWRSHRPCKSRIQAAPRLLRRSR